MTDYVVYLTSIIHDYGPPSTVRRQPYTYCTYTYTFPYAQLHHNYINTFYKHLI